VANTTSRSYTFDKTLPIDEIVEEAYERIGLQNVSGYQLKTAKRSLNILFSEWSNRGLHYWEVANQGFTLVENQNVYTTYRSPSDGASNGLTTTLSSTINSSVTDIPLASVTDMPGASEGGGTITVGSETIRYTGKSAATGAANLTGAIRGSNGTTAAGHTSGDAVTQHATGMDNILEVNYRITSTSVDSPMTEVSRSQYQGYSNKTATGTPTSFFVQRFVDRTNLTIYLTPGAAQDGNKLNFYYARRIQDAGAYGNATNVPFRFVPCMTAGLSFYLAQKNAPQRAQELKLFYEDELARAVKEDADITSTFIAPKTYYPDTAT
jgi:hypothetical protein|tara:strand:+ start:1508 stop:2476 length:969 start_codon:yes stop_codon:yes gene_type:complete